MRKTKVKELRKLHTIINAVVPNKTESHLMKQSVINQGYTGRPVITNHITRRNPNRAAWRKLKRDYVAGRLERIDL
ncbi:MAG: hypothetical protein AAF546_00115 [Verrucomicrobiota bacterium]